MTGNHHLCAQRLQLVQYFGPFVAYLRRLVLSDPDVGVREYSVCGYQGLDRRHPKHRLQFRVAA
jgi:hypothetical protein